MKTFWKWLKRTTAAVVLVLAFIGIWTLFFKTAPVASVSTPDPVAAPAITPPPAPMPTPVATTTNGFVVQTWGDFLKSPIGTSTTFDGADGGRHMVVHAKDSVTGVRYGPDLPISWVEGPTKGYIFPEVNPSGMRSVLRGAGGKPPNTLIPEKYLDRGYGWVLVKEPADAGFFAPAVLENPGEIWAIEDKNGLSWVPFDGRP